MPAPGPCVNSGPPQDPVSPRAACAKDARKAEAREGGLAGVLWGELRGACGEGMPVVRQAVAGSICQWFPGRRECQEACVCGCEPGGDSPMSDRGLYTKRGFIPGSQHLDRLCAGAARGSLSRPAAFH